MNTPLNTVTPVNYYSIPLPMSFNTMVVPSSNKYMVHYAITVGIFILTVTIWFTNNSLIQFICSSLVSLPLCGYLGFFLDQVVDISTSTRQPGQAALILYSCGNLPEIILSVSALYHEKYQIARESNVGSILSNLILVTGCVYYTLYSQWIRNYSQYPMATVQSRTVNVSHNPMSLSLNGEGSTSTDRISEPEIEIKTNYIIGLLTFPLGCYWLITNLNDSSPASNQVSHLVSIILITYYLIGGHQGLLTNLIRRDTPESESNAILNQNSDSFFTCLGSILGLSISSIWLGYVSNILISSIEPTLFQLNIPSSFLNIVFLPIISNSVEAYQSIRSARQGDVVTALSIGLGSVIQILWFVYPMIHLVGWMISRPLILSINKYQLSMLTTSVVAYIVLLPANYADCNLKLYGLSLLGCYLFWAILVVLVS